VKKPAPRGKIEIEMNLSLTKHSSTLINAPHIVLVHGMGSAATAWKPLTPFLQERFNVITVDLPGHGQTPMIAGQSMDPISIGELVVREVKEQFGVTEFDLIGNSWGGWIALEMAASFPESVRSVTALAPAGFWLATYVQRRPGASQFRLLSSRSAALAPSFLKYERSRKLGFGDVSPRWRDFSYELCLDATLAMANSPGYFPAWDGMLHKRFDSQIDSKIPVKIIFGDSDKTLPATTCQERTMAPQHSQWIIFEECGHAPMWDNTEKVAAHVLEIAGVSR
jgi:pimeloyl-ACP methyl ester carboxylesterase